MFSTWVMVRCYQLSKIQLDADRIRIDFHFIKLFREDVHVNTIESLHFEQGSVGKTFGWGELRIKQKNGVEVSMVFVKNPNVSILLSQIAALETSAADPEESASTPQRRSGRNS